MRRVLPYVVVVWGSAIVVYEIAKGLSGSSSYAAGQVGAALFGVLLVVAGAREMKRRSAVS